MFKKCGRQTTDRRTIEAYLSNKLTNELKNPAAGGIDYVRYLSMQKDKQFSRYLTSLKGPNFQRAITQENEMIFF